MASMYLYILIPLILSLLTLGLVRTALWILPGLFLTDYLPLLLASLLSFLVAASLLAPHKDGAFDFRSWEKQNWTLLFFLSGALFGSLLYPSSLLVFGLGAIIPLFWVRIFYWSRRPLAKVWVFHKYFRWLPISAYLFLIFMKLSANT